MTRPIAAALALPLVAALVPLLAVPAAAVPGGPLGTLDHGFYVCELPGDAGGATRLPLPEADFRVVNASSYRAGGRLGIYLLTGDRVVMTSGPHRGAMFHRVSRGLLRRIDADGKDGDLRCVLSGSGAR